MFACYIFGCPTTTKKTSDDTNLLPRFFYLRAICRLSAYFCSNPPVKKPGRVGGLLWGGPKKEAKSQQIFKNHRLGCFFCWADPPPTSSRPAFKNKKDGTENRIAGLDGVFFCGVYRGKVKLTAKENYKIKKKRTKRLLWL
eukprot:GEMP01086562.1.p1 GENE.GEMP01086562.1~~GEMP01086562.1.p1  ORF type:complete len:141 (+),score=2.18 GEMP01086562.1:277-699(+)